MIHARSGKTLEVMGMMLGKIDGDCLVVMDAFALPVEGTETRVSAHEQAYEYLVRYVETMKSVRRGAVPDCDLGTCSHNDTYAAQSSGECRGLVPQPSRIRMLAVRYRREHADAQPDIPGSVRGRCGAPHASVTLRSGALMAPARLTPQDRQRRERFTSARFARFPKDTRPPMMLASTSFSTFPWRRLKNLACTTSGLFVGACVCLYECGTHVVAQLLPAGGQLL